MYIYILYIIYIYHFSHSFPLCVYVLVAKSCQTLCDPMDYSPPGSSVHGDSPGKNTGVGCHALLHSTYSSVYMFISTSCLSFPPLSPLVTISLLSMSVDLREVNWFNPSAPEMKKPILGLIYLLGLYLPFSLLLPGQWWNTPIFKDPHFQGLKSDPRLSGSAPSWTFNRIFYNSDDDDDDFSLKTVPHILPIPCKRGNWECVGSLWRSGSMIEMA